MDRSEKRTFLRVKFVRKRKLFAKVFICLKYIPIPYSYITVNAVTIPMLTSKINMNLSPI